MFVALCTSGCYYSHLASGQLKLLWRREPIEEVIVDPDRPAKTKDMLRLVEAVRQFALELGLRVDDQYTSFVEWPGDRIVTTLVRTRPGSLEAVPHWFPFVGELPYKGYFDRAWAEAEADRMRREEGFDVCVSPITAYSTLGWLADPVTSPMLARGPAILVETLLHELVHATAFLAEEVDFNESVAQFIGQEAAVQFFAQRPNDNQTDGPDAHRVRDSIEDRRQIAAALLAFRNRLIDLEGSKEPGTTRDEVETQERAELARLPLRVLDANRVAARARLSNACLALFGTYARDLPRHARVFEALDRDLVAMIARLALWADEERPVEAFFDIDASIDPSSGDEAPSPGVQ